MNAPSPFSLPLAPIPVSRVDHAGEHHVPIPDGFVDDEVIANLLSTPSVQRVSAVHSDLALSSCEDDFAGWAIKRHSPFRIIAEQQERASVATVEESELTEPGLGRPHRGGHRWWIATATGISSALILSLLFSSLASRGDERSLITRLAGPVESVQSWMGSLAP
ncbi:hypothetical protein OVA24_12770 [Luteolibacter sp. SL250]|uniref:hypothetical protein n=1 Tax=Luteolibacter sp. SL250 TaxID=2995170 RepID=UPI00226FC064|nr:hypothetical protein [Luteolibacter sp. SL250]WAC18111.1 hypothetical protein OVA24_12770 [Luteolibacter sp. SL250]